MEFSTPTTGQHLVTSKRSASFLLSFCLIALFMMGSFLSSAQLLQWNTFGNAGTETSEPSVSNNANITSSNLTLGPGIAGAGNANRFGGSGWFNTGNTNPSTLTEAIAGNDYIQFVVTPNVNFSFTPTSLAFNWDRSGTGPINVALRSSADGFASNLGTVAPVAAIGTSNTLTISGLSNITTATTFRLYGYGGTATGGTGGFDIASNVVNVQLNGTTASAGSPPTVTTTTASNFTTTGAESGGDVTSDGGVSVTARGVAYGTSANPTISGSVTSDGTGTGIFTSTITGLSVNTSYFYRAYATNNINTSYGSESSFFTLANIPGAPTVNGATSNSLNVTVAANGNPSITEFAIQETGSSNYVQSDGSLGGSPVWQTASTWGTKTVTGLAANTSYTFQVKARNGANTETAFSGTTSLSTINANSPFLSASALTAFGAVCLNTTVGANTFTITGTDLTTADVTVGPLSGYSFSKDDITYTASLTYTQGGGSFSELVYVKFTPTLVQSYDGNIPVAGGGASSIDVAASGSGINTTPSVTTDGSASITQVSATLNGTITANGCTAVSAYGIEYSTTNGFAEGSGTQVAGGVLNVNTFSSAVSGLSPNTTYYYKAYATNNGGTSYGSQQSFTTLGLDAPVAIAATDNTTSSFTANWNTVFGADSYRLDVSTTSNFVDLNASVFAGWSFPTSGTTVTPDVANANNTTKTLTTTGGSITDASGFTTRASSANAWQSGSGTKYWQIDFDATGLYDLSISSKQLSSNTGPRDFKLQYRVGAGSFTDVPSGTITVLNDGWVSGTVTNLALPPACDNQAVLSLRWIMTSNTSASGATVSAGGTSRIDNIQVKGKAPFFVAGYDNLTVNGLSQSVTGLSAGTTYYYRVRAFSTNSTSAHSNTITTATCYTITASAGANGSISPNGVTDICSGDQTYTITPDACYSVADVLVDGVSQGAITTYTFTNVTANHTISVTFALSTYAITASSGANGSVTPAGESIVNCADNITYTITPDACYSIADVLVDGVSQGPVSSYTFTNVTATHTISATFAINTFDITASAGANGSVTPAGVTAVNCDGSQAYTITPDPGYTVDDVLVDGISQGPITTYTFSNVTATHTISATFVVTSTFTIVSSAGANGTISPNGSTIVTSGDNQSYTITPDACYSVADVLVDGVSQGPITTYTFTNVLANHTISATFAINTYAITVTAGANGSITPGTGNINCGDNATYTITPDACYSIDDVIVDGLSQGPISTYTFTNVGATHSISASFVLNTYTITASSGSNGTVTPTGITNVNCGNSQAYTITADPGYSVLDVLVDAVSQGAITSYTFTNVNASHTISASFVANTPLLSTTTLAAFGAVCLNTTVGPNTFTITGSDLTNADVNVGPLSGFSFSKDDITYTASLNYTQGGGSFSELVYVKFTPTLVQSYSGSIPVAGGGSVNADVSASGSGVNTTPTVTTDGSSNITQVSATLNGTITANGCTAVTAYGIEFSTTNGFVEGSGTPVAGGILNVNTYSSNLSGLGANTTYYYKAYATNDGGTSYGAQQSFSTLGLDAPVATAATDNTTSSFTANWDGVIGADSYRLDVSTSSSFVSPSSTVIAGWSFPVSGTIVTPDVANANNTTKTVTSTAGGAITSTAGASTQAATCNSSPAWQSGSGVKYWQADVNTTGFYNIKVSSKQRSSGTGPRDFKLQYRIGAGAWSDVTGGTITVADNFVSGALSNVALPSACDNQTSISVRWIMTSNTSVSNATVAATGSSRIDDISVSGNAPLFVAGYDNLTVNGLSQSVTGLTSATTYYYRVRAFSANSTSANSNTITTATCADIVATAGANGSISPSGTTTICEAGSQTYTITPDACYSVADVLVDGVSQGAITSYTFSNVTANHTISATFVLNTYAVTVTAGANGSITPASGNVNCGDNATYTIAPDACYSISDVIVDGISQGAITIYTFTNVQEVHSISASFVQNTYAITVTAGANGSITPASGNVNCGDNATYTITPDACYHVVDVIVDGISQGAITSYTFTNVQAAHSISAAFAINAPFPAPGPLSGPINVCPYIGTGTQLTYSVPAIQGATSYTWIIPPTCTLVSGQGTNSIVLTVGAGFIANANKQIRVTALSSCGNSPQSIFYLLAQLPTTPAPIVASTSNVCPSIGTLVSITYTIPKVAAATSYNWAAQAGTTTITHPNGLGVNDTTVTVTFAAGFTTSSITVSATNDCNTSGTRSLLITRNNPATPGLVSGPTNACEFIAPGGTPATYSVANVAGNVYTWTPVPSAIGLTGQGTNSISFTFPNGFTTGSISVQATNGCGTSGVRTLSIAKLNPATPSVIDVIQTAVCPNRVFTYSLSGTPANSTSVQWTVPTGAGAVLVSGQGSNSITVSYPPTAVAGSVTAQAVNNCGTSVIRLSDVKLPACPPEFAGKGTSQQVSTTAATDLNVMVSPNPTTTDFKLQVITAGKETISVRVLDLQGRALKTTRVLPYASTNIGSDLKAGAYFLEVTQGKTVKTTRVVKF